MEERPTTQWASIGKPDVVRRDANLTDYTLARREFSWPAARIRLSGLPGDRGLNIAYEAVDRHVATGRGAVVALRWVDRTNRFVNLLRELGVTPGQRVFGISSIPTLMVVRDGVVIYAQPGALPAAALEELIENAAAVDMGQVRAALSTSASAAPSKPV